MRSSVLSSDILEQQFGPTQILILYQDHAVRIICTQATATKQILELSLVTFTAARKQAYAFVHATIQAGYSMGKAFREAGIPFVRDVQSMQQQELPSNFERLYKDKAAATIIVTDILVGQEQTSYAHILETYSPAVRWPDTSTSQSSPAISTQLASFNRLLSQIEL